MPDRQKRRGPDLVGVIGLAIIVGILAGAVFRLSLVDAVDELPGLHRLGPDHRLPSGGAPLCRVVEDDAEGVALPRRAAG